MELQLRSDLMRTCKGETGCFLELRSLWFQSHRFEDDLDRFWNKRVIKGSFEAQAVSFEIAPLVDVVSKPGYLFNLTQPRDTAEIEIFLSLCDFKPKLKSPSELPLVIAGINEP